MTAVELRDKFAEMENGDMSEICNLIEGINKDLINSKIKWADGLPNPQLDLELYRKTSSLLTDVKTYEELAKGGTAEQLEYFFNISRAITTLESELIQLLTAIEEYDEAVYSSKGFLSEFFNRREISGCLARIARHFHNCTALIESYK